MSETATARATLAPHCRACGPNGLDLGAGGDPILPTSIAVDRAETDGQRAHVGKSPTHLVGDVANLHWFRDGCLDYVYSSHTLEDAVDPVAWLQEWLRVIRPGGHLVLFLPDQAKYVAYCEAYGQLPNQAHKYADFSLKFVKEKLATLGYEQRDVVFEAWPFKGNPYSFALVIRKH